MNGTMSDDGSLHTRDIIILFLMVTSCHCFDTNQVPLGMENGDIPDSSLSASSSLTNHGPTAARLNNAAAVTAWCSLTNDGNQWLEIDFNEYVTVTAISTQGRSESLEWTESYLLSYKTYDYWQFVVNEVGEVQQFKGNMDSNTIAKNLLPTPVEANKIRIHPSTFYGHTCLRVEVEGYKMGPLRPISSKLGIESGSIADIQLTASSTFQNDSLVFSPANARLEMVNPTGSEMGWCAAPVPPVGEWIQVDLLVPILVTDITLQIGMLSDGTKAFVRSFYIEYSLDGVSFETAKDLAGFTQSFNGVQELVYEKATRTLSVPVFARYIRLVISDYQTRGCARWEIHGYRIQDIGTPLGMEDGSITNAQISSSSTLPTSGPQRGRLNYVSGDLMSGWCAAVNDNNQWLQVDLLTPTRVTGVTIQGRGDAEMVEFVTQFALSYSHNDYSWFDYKDATGATQTFQGSYDRDTPVTFPLLHNALVARYVRLHPVNWVTAICMRIEILGHSNQGLTVAKFNDLGLKSSGDPLFAAALQSSSDFDASHVANEGRLTNPTNAWRPTDGELSPWLQIDLGEVTTVTGIVTQGHPVQAEWTKIYSVNYSVDSVTWFAYNTPENLTANYDQDTPVYVMLNQPISAQYLKLLPLSMQGAASLRIELVGYPAAPIPSTTQSTLTTPMSELERIIRIQNAVSILDVYEAVVYKGIILDPVNQAALGKLPALLARKVYWSLNEVTRVILTLKTAVATATINVVYEKTFFEIMDTVLGVDIQTMTEDKAMLNGLISDVMLSMELYSKGVAANMASDDSLVNITGQNMDLYIKPVTVDDIDTESNTLSISDRVQQNTLTISMKPSYLTTRQVKLSTIKYKNLHENIGGDVEVIQNGDTTMKNNFIFSHVISYQVLTDLNTTEIVSGDTPANLVFKKIEESNNENENICVYWKFLESGGIWSSSGCEVDWKTNTDVGCRCEHLTNFAVLMQVTTDMVIPSSHALALELLTYVGTISSIVSLLFAILAYTYLRLLKTQRIIIHANLAISLAIAQLIYISGIQATFNEGLCTTIAVLLHYFFLVSFMWMLLEGIQLYTKSVRVFAGGISTWVFLLAGWDVGCRWSMVSYGLLSHRY